LTAHLKELDRQVKEFEREIVAWHRNSELSRKLDIIPGIGPWRQVRWSRQSQMLAASRTVVRFQPGWAAKNKVDNTQGWLTELLKRRHPNIAAVALANKNVRTVWAILAHGSKCCGHSGFCQPRSYLVCHHCVIA